jgi:hypothetical protein
MYRAFFENKQQQNFLQSVHTAGYSWDSIANICGVCTRTIRDWRVVCLVLINTLLIDALMSTRQTKGKNSK